MKKLIGLFLFSSFAQPAFAQNYQQAIIDSLKNELSISKIDTSNVLSMVELVNQYKYSNADSALFYAQKALMLSGLGLSLSYDIVKAHGGEIKVETKEGDGTSFIIHLPVV